MEKSHFPILLALWFYWKFDEHCISYNVLHISMSHIAGDHKTICLPAFDKFMVFVDVLLVGTKWHSCLLSVIWKKSFQLKETGLSVSGL